MFLRLLFLVFLSIVHGEPQWYAGYGLTTEEVSSLLQRGCFYGRYGGGPSNSTLVLSHCPSKKLEPIGDFSLTIPLCVIEFDRNLPEESLHQAEVIIEAHNHTKLLYRHDGDFVISSSEEIIELCHRNSFSKNWVDNAISVPSSPYHQPRDPIILNVSKSDPLIVDAIAKASRDFQYESLDKLSAIFTRVSMSTGAMEAAEYLEEVYSSFGFTVTRFDFRSDYSPNVIAEKKGETNPDKIVVVGAHYDSRSTNANSVTLRAPGADDNGSGTVALLDLARVIFESRITFENTIRLCSFSGEEQGLVGSRALAQNWKSNGVDVIGMFNADMLGWTLNSGVRMGMMNRYVDSQMTQQVNAFTELYVPELPIGETGGCCSDQQSFQEQGYPSVGYFENTANTVQYPHYHRSTDLIQYVNTDQSLLESKAVMAGAMSYAVPVNIAQV